MTTRRDELGPNPAHPLLTYRLTPYPWLLYLPACAPNFAGIAAVARTIRLIGEKG